MKDIYTPIMPIAQKKHIAFDVEKIRKDFPVLNQQIYGKPLIYLDNAATTQKPLSVIELESEFYEKFNSNIHRGVHSLSQMATDKYENARKTIREFINADNEREIIFTSGTTESINLVAYTFGDKYIKEGDEIILSEMEHHSNIVPWQIIAERKGASIKVIPMDDNGDLILDELPRIISERTRIISVAHISNALGTINPIKEIINIAHNQNIPVFVDGAQAAQHKKIDVKDLDCDFYAFSGHKTYAPTGIGILYGKEEWLEKLPPFKGGGDMIEKVTFEKTTYNELPLKFEAGTPNYTGAICLAKAVDYIQGIGIEKIESYEDELLRHAEKRILESGNITIIGQAKKKSGAVSFNMNGIHPYDAGMIFDKLGIALRTGTHCAQPVMDHFGITGTIRASFAMYNTFDEIDALCNALEKVNMMFGN